MFQFKINHNILYTRDKLFKAKITDSDSCHVYESMSLTNNGEIYGYLPENRSFHTFNLCLIVAHFYIYTAAKAFLKYKLSIDLQVSVNPLAFSRKQA